MEITRILYNEINNIYYYLHFRRDWFRTFGRQFSNIPPAHRGYGTSVPLRQLERAIGKDRAYIIIIYENRSDLSRTYYGCKAIDWFDYVTDYNTTFKKEKSGIDSIVEGCIPVSMLWNMAGFMS